MFSWYFFFNDPATTEIYPLPLHDALPILVVGHTDDQPVSNPNTIKAGHRDNWYLSAHRAISVGQRLMQVGVNRQRVQVADRKSTRLNSSHANISYAVFCLKKKKINHITSQ